MDNLGYVDFIFLGLIALFAIRGFFNGFIRELFGTIGLIVGIIIASKYAPLMGSWFKSNILDLDSPSLETLIGFVAVFLGIWIIVSLISFLINHFLKAAFSKYINGLLGALFGGIKAFLALAILLHFILYPEFMSGMMTHIGNHSVMYPTMEGVASKVVKLDLINRIPKDSQEMQQKIDEIKDEALKKAKTLNQEIQNSLDSKKEESQEMQNSAQGQ